MSSTAAGSQPRRRKKRPNYGIRTVEVRRGYNGFGFTISGQQPCRLSCIVANSPAEQSGLRAGDFLISVNGLNVSKMPHETVVQLLGNCNCIKMQIAENYFVDSSDEENAQAIMAAAASMHNATNAEMVSSMNIRTKPRYMHHKTKMHRLRNSPQKKRATAEASRIGSRQEVLNLPLRPLMEEQPPPPLPQVNLANKASTSRAANSAQANAINKMNAASALEYRAIVGYMGTIEMPKQISHSSKLQTVRSCIRKLRQEKRQPTTVLMTILPNELRLQATNGKILATYASERLNYVSSSSESENRFFGIVTSAIHTNQPDDDEDEEEIQPEAAANLPRTDNAANVTISNSCHVFVVDIKMCDHQAHLARAGEFRIQCTKDPISNCCLEFPQNSEYVVNLIRSMYTMRIAPPATRHVSLEDHLPAGAHAHSPQPSNHSEVSIFYNFNKIS